MGTYKMKKKMNKEYSVTELDDCRRRKGR